MGQAPFHSDDVSRAGRDFGSGLTFRRALAGQSIALVQRRAPQDRILDVAVEKAKVFISWSGDRSRKIGEALRDWLPDVLPLVDAFLSTEDIEKGAK